MMNILNGGAHADTNVDFQEFMVMPVGAETFSDALRWGAEVFHTLKGVLKKKGYNTAVGDEGGFAPSSNPTKKPSSSSSKPSSRPATPPASRSPSPSTPPPASSTTRRPASTSSRSPTSASSPPTQMVDFWADWARQYPIVSIEDGLAEDDWDGWKLLTDSIGDQIQLVGDDLFVTNTERLQQGIEQKVANSILIKVNQIGTVSETLEAIELGRRYGYTSHHLATAPAKPKTPSSPTSPSPPAPARSKPAPPPAPTASPNTTSSSASKKSSASPPNSSASKASTSACNLQGLGVYLSELLS